MIQNLQCSIRHLIPPAYIGDVQDSLKQMPVDYLLYLNLHQSRFLTLSYKIKSYRNMYIFFAFFLVKQFLKSVSI